MYQPYYYQNNSLRSLITRTITCFDTTHGIDLNSPYQLSYGIEESTKKAGFFGVYMNIMRHLLLISSTPSPLVSNMWKLIDMFVHQVVLLKDTARKVFIYTIIQYLIN